MDRTPLLVFADDWGAHPSSCQHLVRQLLSQRQVIWVNTIGMRTPRLDLATFGRGLGKLRQWLSFASRRRAGPANPRVLDPRMWPWFTRRLDRWINQRLLLGHLVPVVRGLPTPPVAVTTIPVVAGLMGTLPVARWVYYCVDDFGQWPGLDQTTLAQMEVEVVRRADRVLAVSEHLQTRIGGLGRQASLLTHGVDLDFWNTDSAGDAHPTLAGLEPPWIVFWGLIDRRMDLSFVERLATELERGTILLVGPEADPDPRLLSLPRVVRTGSLPIAQLPSIARRAAVLVMPYADLPVTRAMQPLKLKEYLATGRPVVVRDLPSTRDWADCLDLADGPETFAALVRLRLDSGAPADQVQARRRLHGESWAAKARSFAAALFAEAPAPGR